MSTQREYRATTTLDASPGTPSGVRSGDPAGLPIDLEDPLGSGSPGHLSGEDDLAEDREAVQTPLHVPWDCDLVMKGGITSGLVYPKAVVRIAREYRIRSIGGTSIGAIAAALTAAAECWRQGSTDREQVRLQQARIDALVAAIPEGEAVTEPDLIAAIGAAETALTTGDEQSPAPDGYRSGERGFAALYRIPDEIGEDLLGKFQPQPETTGMFQWVMGVLAATNAAQRLLVALFAQFYIFRSVMAVLLALWALTLYRHPLAAFVLAAGLAVLAIGLIAWGKVQDFLRQGRVDDAPAAASPTPAQPGTGWLATLLLTRGGRIGLAVLVVVLAALLAWWGGVGEWIGDHPWVTIGIVGSIYLLTKGDRPLSALWERLQPATTVLTRRARRRVVEAATAIAAVAVLAAVVISQWDAIGDHRGLVAVAIGGLLLGWIIGGVVGVLANVLVFLPHNGNGLCTGLGEDEPSPALTNWLTRKIDSVAGMPGGQHLTVKDLDIRKITLEAMTSDLSRGVPLDLPGALVNYAFRPEELTKLFPSTVVDRLVKCGQVGDPIPDGLVGFADAKGEVGHVPVVVIARMSMSFPVLFSTVPVTYLGTGGSTDQPNVLSDGGIVSNFPVHKFDHALSPYPTFAIDLIGKPGAIPPALAEQYSTSPILPEHSRDGLTLTSSTRAVTGVTSLFSGILSTARGWLDNSQKSLPGYQERIVGIHLYGDEGGLNLTMDKATIARLANRGMFAMHRFVGTWAPQHGVASEWHQHRWLRYRILMRSIENWTSEWAEVYDRAVPTVHEPSIEDLVTTAAGDNTPPDYRYAWERGSDAALAAALTAVWDQLADAAQAQANGRYAAGLSPSPRRGQTFDQHKEPIPEPNQLMMPPFR